MDIDINNYKIEPISKVAKKLNIKKKDLINYGMYKAKIKPIQNNKNGKLILVTSINPTPYGEGKTTISIGINDALRKLKKNSVVVLREPSLGPVFGIKGGACGGGLAQIIPSNDINLHFTGDFHAITSANNLICSVIDNHIYQGNELNIDPNNISFNRCLDVNDRSLRNVTLDNRNEKFNITAASEIMAILCLSENQEDLKRRIDNITIGYTFDKKPIYVKDLKVTDAVCILLKDAVMPNLVQTLENNPAIVHGGPFANIAHGCNSIIATKTALSLADYVVTEAGFGADLGAEKFFDIKSRHGIKADCIVINFTIKALKHNGYCPKEEIQNESIEYINKGFINLETHIENISKFTKNIVVCLNKYATDTENEINYIKDKLKELGYNMQISSSYLNGSDGSINLAKEIIKTCENKNDFKFLYELDEPIQEKITKIIKEIYRCEVKFTDTALKVIDEFNKLGLNNYPICIAKTQYSLSNDKDILGKPSNHTIIVNNIKASSGAEFIIVYLGNIMTMPGLNKAPNYLKMKINGDKIEGII